MGVFLSDRERSEIEGFLSDQWAPLWPVMAERVERRIDELGCAKAHLWREADISALLEDLRVWRGIIPIRKTDRAVVTNPDAYLAQLADTISRRHLSPATVRFALDESTEKLETLPAIAKMVERIEALKARLGAQRQTGFRWMVKCFEIALREEWTRLKTHGFLKPLGLEWIYDPAEELNKALRCRGYNAISPDVEGERWRDCARLVRGLSRAEQSGWPMVPILSLLLVGGRIHDKKGEAACAEVLKVAPETQVWVIEHWEDGTDWTAPLASPAVWMQVVKDVDGLVDGSEEDGGTELNCSLVYPLYDRTDELVHLCDNVARKAGYIEDVQQNGGDQSAEEEELLL